MALLRNQAEALLRHERIVTTIHKAKELRPFVERLITVAKRGVKAAEPKGRTLAAKRLVGRVVVNDEVVEKLFDQLALRFMERPGGYTRILRLGHRRGDGGEIAQIELVGSEYDPKKAEAEKAEQDASEGPKQKSVGERLRAAAQSIRGGKKDAKTAKADSPKGKASRPAKGAAKKTTTPRKAGGS
jgi:large subunit ribosomal protein L17